jgi:glycosyltransferase involved in cell wall biosynthesis
MRLGILPEQGGSIANLRRSGQDTRFVEQYLRLYLREFDEVHYFSYARERLDQPIAEHFHLHPGSGTHRWLRAVLLPFVEARSMRRLSVMRVLQATGALPARLARLFFGVPFVVTYGYHYGDQYLIDAGPKGRWRARLLDRRARWALRCADGVIVTTPALAEFARRFTPAKRIALIPNSVDTARFSPAPEKTAERQPRRRLIAVGQLTARKNNRLLLEAVARTGRDDIEVVILGAGPEEQSLRRLADEKSVTLNLPGVVSNEMLPGRLRSADIYLLTSLSEGHPKSLLEAMSVGLPCIGTDVKGIRDVVVNGETGWLCPLDPDAVAATINRVLSDVPLARSVGTKARQFILDHYDAKVIMAREVAFLKAVARGSRGS